MCRKRNRLLKKDFHKKLMELKQIKLILLSSLCIFISGCGDFFAEKPTELQSKSIIDEVRRIEKNPNLNNPVPELYRQPPQVEKYAKGFKLYYFTKQHSAQTLSEMVKGQLDMGKINVNGATNQLIVDCADENQAHEVIAFLDKVDVPPIQVNIDCLIIENYADITTDWETDLEITNLLNEGINLGGDKALATFPGASLREAKRGQFGLDVGWEHIGNSEFRFTIDMLVSRGYLKILMNPKLETVNGKKAKITSRDNVPIQKIVSQNNNQLYNLTDYQWVEDSLEVTPNVYADGSVGLHTVIKIGSKSTPEGVVQSSIITERNIEVSENRIRPGDSLVIGGLRKSEKRSVVRGVPFLKDLPLIGVLFSSKDFEERAKEIIFILTPTVSTSGRPYDTVINEIEEKIKDPVYEPGITERVTDPFASSIYTKQVKRQADEADFGRVKAELQAAETSRKIHEIETQLNLTQQEGEVKDQTISDMKAETFDLKKKLEQLIEKLKEAKQEQEKKAEALKPDTTSEPSKAEPAKDGGAKAVESEKVDPAELEALVAKLKEAKDAEAKEEGSKESPKEKKAEETSEK